MAPPASGSLDADSFIVGMAAKPGLATRFPVDSSSLIADIPTAFPRRAGA